jgi:hypothetical protein
MMRNKSQFAREGIALNIPKAIQRIAITCRSFKSRFLGEKSIKIDEIWSILSIGKQQMH